MKMESEMAGLENRPGGEFKADVGVDVAEKLYRAGFTVRSKPRGQWAFYNGQPLYFPTRDELHECLTPRLAHSLVENTTRIPGSEVDLTVFRSNLYPEFRMTTAEAKPAEILAYYWLFLYEKARNSMVLG